MFSRMQHISARSEKVAEEHDDDDATNNKDDDSDDGIQALNFDEEISAQVNILASRSQHLLEGDTQKQVNGFL